MNFMSTMASELHYRCWDDKRVLFDPASGSTHLMAPALLDILEVLQGGSTSLATLNAHFSASYPDEDSASPEAQLKAIMANLEDLELISACHS